MRRRRILQRDNDDLMHHPNEKINQLGKHISVLDADRDLNVLELFGGYGNLTEQYLKLGTTTVLEKDTKKVQHLKDTYKEADVIKADSFLKIYDLIYNKNKYDIVDVDPYGFPNRLFPHIYLTMEDSLFFVTMPKPYVNVLNALTQTHLTSYFKHQNPSIETIIEQFCSWGLCHWRYVQLLDCIDLKSVWRICFHVKKVKATEYTNTVNRRVELTEIINKNPQIKLFDY